MANPKPSSYCISPAKFPDDLPAIKVLFYAYATALGLDLTFQDFASEVDSLPGKYAPERGGVLLVALSEGVDRDDRDDRQRSIIGCVALRSLPSPNTASTTTIPTTEKRRKWCEMKRLYITPSARGTGLGAKLVEAVLEHARNLGFYRGIKLDTLPGENMAAARTLYRRYGFVEMDRYYETPIEGTIFMGLEF